VRSACPDAVEHCLAHPVRSGLPTRGACGEPVGPDFGKEVDVEVVERPRRRGIGATRHSAADSRRMVRPRIRQPARRSRAVRLPGFGRCSPVHRAVRGVSKGMRGISIRSRADNCVAPPIACGVPPPARNRSHSKKFSSGKVPRDHLRQVTMLASGEEDLSVCLSRVDSIERDDFQILSVRWRMTAAAEPVVALRQPVPAHRWSRSVSPASPAACRSARVRWCTAG
jgi:hypothetical protein